MIEYSKPEINEIQRPKDAPAVIGSGYPYSQLPNSRSFEELLFLLFKQEIDQGEWKNQFDAVDLMQGVREKGRDCVLRFKGAAVGLIQCKHSKNSNGRLGKNDCLKEIIKFLL